MSKKIDFALNTLGVGTIIVFIVIDLIKNNDLVNIIAWLIIVLSVSLTTNWFMYKRIKKIKYSYIKFTNDGVMISNDGEHWQYGINNIKDNKVG